MRGLGAALYVSLILKVRVAILQNGGIRLCFHAIVRPGRMPPMDAETIGGISTGLSLYSGLVCMPPYSQNAGVAISYIIVRRRPDWLERGASIWELVIYLGRESSN